MVKNGELILQGKSSCMPAHCLLVNEEGNEDERDGRDDMSGIFERIPSIRRYRRARLPGNKTTHLAALLDKKRIIRIIEEGKYLRSRRTTDERKGYEIRSIYTGARRQSS